MLRPPPLDYREVLGVLASMHGKERVIAPVLAEGLGLRVELAPGIDTDAFGTFSGEVARRGSQLDAARAKIKAGFVCLPEARVGLASEGSFGPHPQIPWVAVGSELILMIDRESGLELSGHHVSAETNYAQQVLRDSGELADFARRVDFPAHALIVMACEDEAPAPQRMLRKGIRDEAALQAAVREAIACGGAALVETDMRAHLNPTRMRAVGEAARDLVRRFHSRCPGCACPGFDVVERIPGLPCAWCRQPTQVVMAERRQCLACGHEERHPVPGPPSADPGQCDRCNP